MSNNILEILCPVSRGFVMTTDGNRNDCTHIKCHISYELGGHNMFTGQDNKRGYYLHVAPVEVGENFVKWTAFTGGKFLLTECVRRSPRKEQLAKVMFEKIVREAVNRLFDPEGIDMSGLPYPPENGLDRAGVIL